MQGTPGHGFLVIAGCLLLAGALPHGVAVGHGALTGSIRGTVQPAELASGIKAVDRAGGTAIAGTIDPGTGAFAIDGLAPGTAYDCIIEYPGGRLEGIDMSVPRSDYEEEQPLGVEDEAIIREKIDAMNRFEDRVEVLALEGNIQHAVVLLNKLRTRPFYGSAPGEVIWRLERWRFECPEETWVKVRDELFTVLYRERITASDYEKKAITLDPALGGLRPDGNGLQIQMGSVTLPDSAVGIRFRRQKQKDRP